MLGLHRVAGYIFIFHCMFPALPTTPLIAVYSKLFAVAGVVIGDGLKESDYGFVLRVSGPCT